jgi:hypothetical protein
MEEEELAALRAVVQKAHNYVHEVDTVLRIFLGELDLAVIRAKKGLDAFYDKHPELR